MDDMPTEGDRQVRLPEAPGAVRLRRLDAGPDTWAQFHRCLSPVRPPVRRYRFRRHTEAGGHKFGHKENQAPQLPVAKDTTCTVN